MANSLIIKESKTVVVPYITRDAVCTDGTGTAAGTFHLWVAVKKDGKSVYTERRGFGDYSDIKWIISNSFPEDIDALISQVRALQRYYDCTHTLGLYNSLHQACAERNVYAVWDAHHGFSAISPMQKERRRVINASI